MATRDFLGGKARTQPKRTDPRGDAHQAGVISQLCSEARRPKVGASDLPKLQEVWSCTPTFWGVALLDSSPRPAARICGRSHPTPCSELGSGLSALGWGQVTTRE